MRILVTGAGGMLGRDVMRLAGPDAVGLGHGELDIADAEATAAAVLDARPDVVVNCAAYTDVDAAEAEPDLALAVNGEGARHVSAAAAAVGAAVIYVSSDYVFDGQKREPYVESDATGPISSYGRSKLAGERATAEANGAHFIVRSSWLFGEHGHNFVDTMLSLDAEELRVVHDQVGCPTFTGHLAEGLLKLAHRDDHGIHHLAGAGRCSWFEFAREIFERAGVERRVIPCTTEEFPRPAPRPAWSVLGTERDDPVRLPSWQEGLDAYLGTRSGESRLGRLRTGPA
jgi:dTDP-4-dehydrorhamnose reductase